MRHLPNGPFLCVITDDELPADRIIAAVQSVCTAARAVVQLRARNRNGSEFYELARTLREVTTAHESLLIVNDRLDIALAVGADGVHLPAAGIPAVAGRSVIGRHAQGAERLLVGVSVHAVAEIRAASMVADYFQFGPVFATPSKARYGAPQGIAGLEAAVAASADVQRPMIAVGGIDLANAGVVTATGAAGIAVIRAVMNAINPGVAAAELVAAITRRPV